MGVKGSWQRKGQGYAEGWDAIFGKKQTSDACTHDWEIDKMTSLTSSPPKNPATCLSCGAKGLYSMGNTTFWYMPGQKED